MEEVHSEIEETSGHRLLIDEDMDLIQVPASGSHQKSAHLVVELVDLASFLELEGSLVGLDQVQLTVEEVFPGRSQGIFEVSLG